MFRYKLRTLLIVLALGPPVLAALYFVWPLVLVVTVPTFLLYLWLEW